MYSLKKIDIFSYTKRSFKIKIDWSTSVLIWLQNGNSTGFLGDKILCGLKKNFRAHTVHMYYMTFQTLSEHQNLINFQFFIILDQFKHKKSIWENWTKTFKNSSTPPTNIQKKVADDRPIWPRYFGGIFIEPRSTQEKNFSTFA